MADEAENAVYALEEEIRKIFAYKNDVAIQTIFNELGQMSNISANRYRINLLKMFDDAAETVAHLPLPDERVARSVSLILKAQEVLVAVGINKAQDIKGHIGMAIPDLLSQIGNTVSTAHMDKAVSLDRKEFTIQTGDLIAAINESNLIGYAKKALLLKLNAIQRIVQDTALYSDSDIRRRVKSIVADFSAEFEKMDKEYEGIRQKIMRWAKATSRPGIVALALTADVSAVQGLLPPPS